MVQCISSEFIAPDFDGAFFVRCPERRRNASGSPVETDFDFQRSEDKTQTRHLNFLPAFEDHESVQNPLNGLAVFEETQAAQQPTGPRGKRRFYDFGCLTDHIDIAGYRNIEAGSARIC